MGAANWPGFPAADDLDAAAMRATAAGRPAVRFCVDTALRGRWSERGGLDDPEPDVESCGQRHVAVTPEGDVFPCSHSRFADYRMGDLLIDDVVQIWSRGPGE